MREEQLARLPEYLRKSILANCETPQEVELSEYNATVNMFRDWINIIRLGVVSRRKAKRVRKQFNAWRRKVRRRMVKNHGFGYVPCLKHMIEDAEWRKENIYVRDQTVWYQTAVRKYMKRLKRGQRIVLDKYK